MSRILSTSLIQLTEASYNPTTGELLVTVIQPGLSKNDRFYSKEVLERDHGIFDGNKMFADHQTEAERKAKPEGSVNNWVAQLGKTWAEADGTIKGKATVIDPIFKAKLDTLASKNLLNEMGISIRAVGTANKKTMQGKEVTNVESLVASRSVDFVTYAGAGGRVEMMEAENNELDVDLIDEAQLRVRRPDLVQLIESAKGEQMKTIEQQLAEAQGLLEAERLKVTTLTTANTKLVESTRAANKTAAVAELEKLLSESKLTDPSKKRIRAQFKEADKIEGMKEAVEAEEAYVKEVGGKAVTPKNLGNKDNVQESGGDVKVTPEDMVKAYVLVGMSEAEAKIAAGA